jgi:hypothetical protein
MNTFSTKMNLEERNHGDAMTSAAAGVEGGGAAAAATVFDGHQLQKLTTHLSYTKFTKVGSRA